MKASQIFNIFIKALIRSFGIVLLFFGLMSLPNIFSEGGLTKNILTLSLRFINVFTIIFTGYGLLRLRKWAVYGMGLIVALTVVISFHNLYISTTKNIPKEAYDLSGTAWYTVIFLIIFALKNKFLTNKSEPNDYQDVSKNKTFILEFIFIILTIIGFGTFIYFRNESGNCDSGCQNEYTEDTLMTAPEEIPLESSDENLY